MLLTSPLSSPLKNPVRDVFSPAGSSQSLTAQVQALFASRNGGMWDLGDTSTLYQNPLFGGVNPVTTVGQAIGTVADVSRQSGFTDVAGYTWTVASGDGVLSVVGNQVTITGATTTTRVDRVGGNTATLAGGLCKMVVTATWSSVTSPVVWCRGNPTTPTNGVALTVGNQLENSLLDGFQVGSGTATFTINEFKMWPGKVATQFTAGSRPLFSARKNLLTKTEVFTDAAWGKLGVTVTANNATAPDGTLTASTITFPSGGGANQIYQALEVAPTPVTQGVWLRSASTVSVNFGFYDSASDVQTISVTSAWTYFTKTRASGLTGGDRRGLWIYPNAPATIEIWHPQVEVGSAATSYQRVNTDSDYDTVGFPAFAQFDAVDDALLFPAITFGGAFNTFVSSKVTGSPGLHLWRTADSPSGFWAAYANGDVGSPTPTVSGVGSPSYAINGVALSPVTRGQLYSQINGVASVVETTGIVLSAETALQMAGYGGFQFQGNAHRVLMISGTLTAGEKLLCRQWAAQGNGVTVV